MDIGKVPNSILEKIILNNLRTGRSEVIVRPGIGEDCSAVDFGEYTCVLSSDPITGAAKEIGRLAVHISCNDIASSGVEPIGLLVTVLCPPEASEQELEMIMKQLSDSAASINVDILGGHTEITTAVTRYVITCTAVGRCRRDRLITTSGAKAGDYLVMTKHAGLEGASIIAHEKESELSIELGPEAVKRAKDFIHDISVVRDGIAAAEFGANAMHDVTEGGILGAVWEMCEASGNGADVFIDKIPVDEVTKQICDFYKIDHLKLISSGSMLISAPDGEGMVRHLKSSGIQAAIIGRLNSTGKKMLISGDKAEIIPPPAPDELYKVV